jgi:hypothetical protein
MTNKYPHSTFNPSTGLDLDTFLTWLATTIKSTNISNTNEMAIPEYFTGI